MIDKLTENMSEDELVEARANSEEAVRLLEMASIQLQRCRPFYGTMLASMPVQEATQWLSTVATDGRTFYYSVEFIAGMTPKRRELVFSRIDALKISVKKRQKLKEKIDVWFKKKTPREVVFLFEHEIRHVLNLHIYRGKGYIHWLFNIAADHGINTGLVMEHSKTDSMGSPWFPQKEKTVFIAGQEFGFMELGCCDFKYLDWATEDIYKDLLSKYTKGKSQRRGYDVHLGQPGEGNDEEGEQSSLGGDEDGDSEDPNGDDLNSALGADKTKQPELSDKEREENDAIMRRTCEVATINAGKDAPKEARQWLDEGQQAKVNYVTLIRQTIMSLRSQNQSYRRPSRRSWSTTRSLRAGGYITRRQTVVFPGKEKMKTIKVFIGFDVSGSFNDGLLRHVRHEVGGLMNQYDEFEVVLFCWSTHVGKVVRYTHKNASEINDYTIETSGGTDVFCVFNYLDSLDEKVDQLIIFTDGVFSSPATHKDWARKYKDTLWIRLGGGKKLWQTPFGTTIEFDEYL